MLAITYRVNILAPNRTRLDKRFSVAVEAVLILNVHRNWMLNHFLTGNIELIIIVFKIIHILNIWNQNAIYIQVKTKLSINLIYCIVTTLNTVQMWI